MLVAASPTGAPVAGGVPLASAAVLVSTRGCPALATALGHPVRVGLRRPAAVAGLVAQVPLGAQLPPMLGALVPVTALVAAPPVLAVAALVAAVLGLTTLLAPSAGMVVQRTLLLLWGLLALLWGLLAPSRFARSGTLLVAALPT